MKEQSTFGGFMSLSAATLIVKILSLLYIPVLIGILGDEGYGIYTASYQIFIVIYAITNSGIPQSISKLVSELTAVGNYKDALKAFRMARFMLISIGFILSLVFFLLAKYISNTLYYPRSYMAILALAPTIFFSTMATTYRGYFQGRGNMMPTAMSQVLEQLVNVVFTLLLAYLFIRVGLEEAAGGGALATSIASLAAVIFLTLTYKKNKESKIWKLHDPEAERHSNKALFKRILNYSIPLTAYTTMYNLGSLIDLRNVKSRLMVSGYSESEATTLFGLLSKYIQLIGIPNAIVIALSVAILPAVAAAAARKDFDKVIEKINMSFKICFFITIPSAVGLSVLSGPIYRLMGMGKGSYIMLYGSFVLILMSQVQIFSTILQGLGRLYLVSTFLIVGIAAKIITNYITVSIPSINIMGAVIGNTVYYIIPLILGNIILARTLKTKINVFKHAVKPLISSAVMGVVIFFSYRVLNYLLSFIGKGYLSVALPTVICIAIGAYVYFLVLVRIKGLTEEDMGVVPARLQKFIPKHIKKFLVD